VQEESVIEAAGIAAAVEPELFFYLSAYRRELVFRAMTVERKI
jgi:hypothetical protein